MSALEPLWTTNPASTFEPAEPVATNTNLSSTVKFVVASVVVVPLTVKSPSNVMFLNVGESDVPNPKDVLTVAPDSYANAPAAVATINSPSALAAPNVSKSSSTPSLANVTVSEPAVVVIARPAPAAIVSVSSSASATISS